MLLERIKHSRYAKNTEKAPINLSELAAAPTNKITEDIYLDDGTNSYSGAPAWFRYDGSAWEEISSVAGILDKGTAAGQMAFWNGTKWTYTETTELFWDDTNKRLGIGTATPGYRLDIIGNDAAVPFRVQYASTTEGLPANLPLYTMNLFVRNNTNAYANIATYIGGSNSYTGLTFGDKDHYASGSISYYNSDDSMRFVTSVAERMRIESGGNVGIGTTGPDRKLDILDASNPQLRLTHTDGSVYADLQTNSNGTLVLSPSGGSVLFPQGTIDNLAIAFGDGDSGIFEIVDDVLTFITAGLYRFYVDGYYLQGSSETNRHPAINFSAAVGSGNPGHTFRGDSNTGMGLAADDQLSLIAGGVEGIRITEATNIDVTINGETEIISTQGEQLTLAYTSGSVETILNTDSSGRLSITPSGTGGQVILNATPGAYNATPTLSFGDGDTGFYENADDSIAVSIFGVNRFFFNTQYLRGAAADRFDIDHTQGISSTVPIYSFRGDNDTGINRAAADQLSLIAGGVEGIRITEAAGVATVNLNSYTSNGFVTTTSGDGTLAIDTTTYYPSANIDDGTTAGQMLYWNGSKWTYDSTSDLYWNAASNYLGLGTASPAAPLHIYKTGTTVMKVESAGANSRSIIQLEFNTSDAWEIAHNILTDSSDKFTINEIISSVRSFWFTITKTTGYVGLYQYSPTERLQVNGNVFLDGDNDKVLLGTGKDMGIYYDGTNGNIDTDLIAASDLVIDCGSNKTLVLETTTWDDQQVILGAVRLGASSPTWTAYKGSEVLAFNKAQDNKIYFTAQLSHRYKLGTDLHFHVHVTVPDDTAGDVRWVLTYSWADIGSDFPAETTASANQTIAANSADSHLYFEITDAVSSASAEAGVSGVLLCSLMREGTHADDDYDNDVYLAAMDFHFQVDTMGSRQETTK